MNAFNCLVCAPQQTNMELRCVPTLPQANFSRSSIIGPKYNRVMEPWQEDRIASILDHTNPTFLAEMESGYAVIADTQFLPGYSILLPKHHVAQLNDLSVKERTCFLRDMTILGDAIALACKPIVRLNYDILGNTDTFLHAHVFPRYSWEPTERLKMPTWLYPSEYWTSDAYRFDREEYSATRQAIAQNLQACIQHS